jgi:peptidyl-prolyl cis-trans isomerase C
MKIPGKAIAAIAVVALLAGALIWAQSSSTKPKAVKLTAKDMEVFVAEVLPPSQQQQLASSPDQKKELVKTLKTLFALAQVAEEKGYATHADVKSQIDLQTAIALRQVYEKKNPGVKATDEEVNAYHQAHPNEWNEFLEANPSFKMQAQGAQGEGIKKEFGEIKVIAERARKEGLDQSDATKIRLLIERSQALARAYVTELQKDPEKLVSDADVEQYYNEHKNEFEEVKARHILISTTPPDAAADDGHGHSKKEAGKGEKEPKALSKDEARKKAQLLLERARKGEDFTKLAQDNSDEPGAKTKGGDLGYFTKGMMVPQFDQVAFALKPGELSEVVETEFGFHVIKVEDHRTAPMDDTNTRQKIVEKLKQEKLDKMIQEITDKSTVEVAEDFNINPPPAAPMPQMPGAVTPPPGENR